MDYNKRAQVYNGLILSGEKLIDDKVFKQELFLRFKQYPESIGGEMEGFDVSSASMNDGIYPEPFTREKSMQWIEWNLESYATYGFGLWAVTLKENNLFIGDCRITMQQINGKMEPEIGYHINRAYTGKGYATEVAQA